MLIKNNDSSHWYRRNETGAWEACYEIPKANGDGTRAPDIRDARKMSLAPSVTNILGLLAKPALNRWLQEQAILSALTLPKVDGEPADAFAARCIEDMEEQSKAAREKGTAIHDLLAGWCMGLILPEGDLAPFVKPTIDWFRSRVIKIHATEAIVGDDLGFAGRLDLHCVCDLGTCTKPAVIDYKTQKVKRDKKGNAQPVFYDEWPIQLAAYAKCVMNGEWPCLVSVIINTETPEPPYVKVWEDVPRHWEAFQRLFWLWKYLKQYDPAISGQKQDKMSE